MMGGKEARGKAEEKMAAGTETLVTEGGNGREKGQGHKRIS